MKIRKKYPYLLLVISALLAFAPISKAETLSIDDASFSIINAPTGSSILGARWGLWDGLNFIQGVTNIANLGYVDLSGPELSITLNQIDNSLYPTNTQLAVAIYGNDGVADSQSVNFSTASGLDGFKYAVLTDTNWLAPNFGNNATFVDFSFTTNTTAVAGSYNYNGGNEQITLIPEPSTYALLLMGGAILVGYLWRQHRKHPALD